MKECEECGKRLGILQGYQHPTMGKKHLLCSPCYDQVSASVEKWGEFVRTNSLNISDLLKKAGKDGIDLRVLQKIVQYSGVATPSAINESQRKVKIKSDDHEKIANIAKTGSDTT
jgi:hypothetical protein